MNGFSVEQLMFWLFNLCGFNRTVLPVSNKTLLQKAGTFTQKWEHYYQKKKNRRENWALREQSYILDVVYKLDAVIETCGCKYGIQITTNEDALHRKRSQAVERLDLYKELGLQAVVIVFVVPGQSEGYSFWSNLEAEAVKEQVYDFVIAAEDNLEVGNYITNFTVTLP